LEASMTSADSIGLYFFSSDMRFVEPVNICISYSFRTNWGLIFFASLGQIKSWIS
jgi:hypothetical protein